MTTLLPSLFIIDMGSINDLWDRVLPENASIVYSVMPAHLPDLDSFYAKIISAEKKFSFCLLIDMDDLTLTDQEVMDKLIDFIVPVSFHYRQLQTAPGSPFILFGNRMADPKIMILRTREALLAQGFNDIDALLLDGHHAFSWPGKKKKGTCAKWKEGSGLLLQTYLETIKSIDLPDLSFFFAIKDPAEFPELEEIIRQAENRLSVEHPSLHHLLDSAMNLLRERRRLRFTFGALQERLDSKDSYHSFYHPESGHLRKQVTEIAEFYKYEYEILPLWYKRLGHIIKVLMGKRTFRSLFNDNVKKYKD